MLLLSAFSIHLRNEVEDQTNMDIPLYTYGSLTASSGNRWLHHLVSGLQHYQLSAIEFGVVLSC